MAKLQTNVVERKYSMLCEHNGRVIRYVCTAESAEAAKLKLPRNMKFIKFFAQKNE